MRNYRLHKTFNNSIDYYKLKNISNLLSKWRNFWREYQLDNISWLKKIL